MVAVQGSQVYKIGLFGRGLQWVNCCCIWELTRRDFVVEPEVALAVVVVFEPVAVVAVVLKAEPVVPD